MKRVLVLDKSASGAWYGQAAPDGSPLRCYRLEQAGRLELLRILNDPPPYWFVLIRNFDQSETGTDRKALRGITTPWGNGVWRYLDEGLARAKFAQLAQLFIFVADRAKAMEIRSKRRERIQGGALASYAFKKLIYSDKCEGVKSIAGGHN